MVDEKKLIVNTRAKVRCEEDLRITPFQGLISTLIRASDYVRR